MPGSNKQKPNVSVRVIKSTKSEMAPIKKAEVQTHMSAEDTQSVDFLQPPYDLSGLSGLVNDSTILPQCVRAYGQNIAGFGIALRYRDDPKEETEEMRAEWTAADRVIKFLSTDESSKDLFKNFINARETYGIAYLECVRDISGNVIECALIDDSSTILKGRLQEEYQDMLFSYDGAVHTRKKRFRKYKQVINGKTIYFKEFGDPRMMDNRTGEYVDIGSQTLELRYQANELLESKIGSAPYGTVRWIGQILGLDGSKKAEKLNNNYFTNGRHTPLLIAISGGSLTEDSYEKLESYINDIKGENGQHAFLLLEVENDQTSSAFEESQKPVVEVKDIAGILQKDGLFHEYQEDNRKNVQSAFLLPDIYVARSTDYNRSTAQTALEITENQVFQPERDTLSWILNNKLLNSYGFRFVEAYFKAPEISNPEDMYRILTVAGNNGGITPNKAKAIAYKALGEVPEDYTEEWGDIPIRVQELLRSQTYTAGGFTLDQASKQLEKTIEKADAAPDRSDEVVAIMKEVRRILSDMQAKEE